MLPIRTKMAIHKLDTQMYVGQKAFIKRGDKVLVMRDPKYAINGDVGLDFPGGKYRFGNDIHEELKREIDEETSLKVKIGKPFTTWFAEYLDVEKHQKRVYLVGFICNYVSGEVRLSEEHDKFEWVDRESYRKWYENTDYFKALEEYFKISGT